MRNLRQQLAGRGMRGVRLRNHRIARRDGRREITPGNGVERVGKIIRAEHQHRLAERCEVRAQATFRINHGVGPGASSYRHRRLPQLAGSARKFVAGQARWRGQGGFLMCDGNQLFGGCLDAVGVAFKEARDFLGIDCGQGDTRDRRCRNRGFNIVRATDRKAWTDQCARRRIAGAEIAFRVSGRAPFVSDQNPLQGAVIVRFCHFSFSPGVRLLLRSLPTLLPARCLRPPAAARARARCPDPHIAAPA